MMPQVHCAEGSRVKNIKKQFEVLSNDHPVEAHVNSASALGYSSDSNVLETSPCNDPQRHFGISRTSKQSTNSEVAAVKHDKCNIKRSPAFRCDRIVKGKNVTGHMREKNISVEDKVKLFEDGKSKFCERMPIKIQRNSARQNTDGNGDGSVVLKGTIPDNSSIYSRTARQTEILETELSRGHHLIHSTPHTTRVNVLETEVPVHFSNSSLNCVSKSKNVVENINLNNGFCDSKKEISSAKNIRVNKVKLNDILQSPLPRGPPPRKPPRTFAHLSQSAAINEEPKPSHSITTGPTESGSCPNISFPPLTRCNTESQIQLRNKLEIALSKVPSGNTTHRFSVGETKTSRAHPVKPSSKPDLSPSALLVGCLSLGCVNSNLYEEVGAQRKLNSRPSDRRESLDIRLSSADIVEAKNNLVSLMRSHSEDHIYAVPFGDSTTPVKCNIRPESLIRINSEIKRCETHETFKGVTNFSPPEPNGLHYMCTPIVGQGKLSSVDEDIPQVNVGVRLNSTGIINRVQKNSPSHLHLTGFMMASADPTMAGPNQAHPRINQNLDGSPGLVTSESPLDEINESNFSLPLGNIDSNENSKTCLSTETEEENVEEDQDPMIREMLEKRKGYVRRVCNMFKQMQLENSSYTHGVVTADCLSKNGQNSLASVDPTSDHVVPTSSGSSLPHQATSNPFPHLFECVLLVGLTLSSKQGQEGTYEPYIKSKFPADVLVPPWIEHLCFPDATNWPLVNKTSSSNWVIADSKKKDLKAGDEAVKTVGKGCTYSLVITGANGNRRFGYCRRVLPEGGSMCLPLNYCLISPYRANGFYLKVLAELESRHGEPEVQNTAFLQELYSCKLPGPGQIPCPCPSSYSSPSSFLASLRRPYDTRLEERDVMELFCCLEVAVFLDVFASLLLERKVILTSSSLSKLSSCIEALQSALYPFSWQHTFIPILPAPMLEICSAPTPYIIGVLKGSNGQVPTINFDEGIMVDLDTSSYIKRVGDEGSILPPRIKRALRAALRLALGITPSPLQNCSKNNPAPDGASPVRNVLVSEAFLRMFLMVVGHYPNHIAVQQDGRQVFQRESFIKAMPFDSVQMFLEWFTETSMFSAFIDARLEGCPEIGDGIFEQRAHQFCEELKKDALFFLKNYKMITKKRKKFGDRFKDWTPFS
ncbi:uncharacterized protein [Hetaerina americana]|uniref:uncharacterized protein n=1 Tax=Hetaerina americana TaxID=62018 RepID=UPI003A7F1603